MKKDKLTGGGRFNPDAPNIYFIASDTSYSKRAAEKGLVRSILVPMASIKSKDGEVFKKWSDEGMVIMVDSGVYSLAQKLVKQGMSQTKAFGTPPEEIPGFDKLKAKYIKTIQEYEPDIWGYVEIDFGGMENKKRIRAELESLGLRPIPVFHPFNDPPDYFDELASTYDRICIGNIVYAENAERARILHALHERKKPYEPLWIHLLGHTANSSIFTFPQNSCDSSSWLSGSRHGTIGTSSGGYNVGNLERKFIYKVGDNESLNNVIQLMSYNASILEINWQVIEQEKEKLYHG